MGLHWKRAIRDREFQLSFPGYEDVDLHSRGYTDESPSDMLRVLGIVPREPTPLPLEERPEDELNNDELRHVVRLLKEVSRILPNLDALH